MTPCYYSFFAQFAFGVIPNVRAKGVASTKAAELLNNMQQEDPVNMDDVTSTDVLFLRLIFLNSFESAYLFSTFGVLDGDSRDKHCYSFRQGGKSSIILYLYRGLEFKQPFCALDFFFCYATIVLGFVLSH
jgi:hypothetical protein